MRRAQSSTHASTTRHSSQYSQKNETTVAASLDKAILWGAAFLYGELLPACSWITIMVVSSLVGFFLSSFWISLHTF